MPNGPDFNLARDIWATRPKPFSAAVGALPAVGVGAGLGASLGGLPGAAVGAGLGAVFGSLGATVRKVTESMSRLETTTRGLIEQYKGFDPIINRLRHQWRALDRRMNRAWAQTIAPTLKKFSDIGIEFRERWTRVKIEVFEAIKPHIDNLLKVLDLSSKGLLVFVEGLTSGLTKLMDGINWLLRKLGLLKGEEEERTPTKKLTPFPIDWPTVEGPLTGAMKRIKDTGLPFSEEVRPEKEDRRRGTKEESPVEPFDRLFPGGQESLSETLQELRKGQKKSDVNIELKVGDSKELTAVFERAWRKATYELRKLEAENTYRAFELQQQSTYT